MDLTAVCEWQYGPGSYAVQTGDTFWTYACYQRGSEVTSAAAVTTASPIKVDYSNARNLPIGGQASVITGSGSPLPVYRDHDANQLRFAQLRPGTIVAVLAGPIYSDGYIWWQIRAPTGISGWVIAFDGQSERLRSLSNHAP